MQHRCHIGHSFTAQALIEAQENNAEEALWLALRTLQERGRLLERMRDEAGPQSAEMYAQRSQKAFAASDS